MSKAPVVSWTDWVFERISAVLMALIVGAVFVSTVSRYVFNASVIWSEEVPILLQVWLTFLAGVLALRRREHVNVDIVVKTLPENWRRTIDTVVQILSLGLMLVLTWLGMRLFQARVGEISAAVGFPMGLFLLPLVVGSAFMSITICWRLWQSSISTVGVGILIVAGSVALLFAINRLTGGGLARISPLVFLVVGFVVLVVSGMPIAFAFGFSSVILLLFAGLGSLTIVAQRLVAGPTSFVLIAVPLFILAGALMEIGGISRRLIAFASSMVGHIRGGLAIVVILSEMLFSGISGSSTADVSAVGSILIPAMKRAGYRGEESAAIVAAASAMGILVPPCILMVILAALANISVIALFVAGFIPAFVLAAGLFAVVWYKARKEEWPREPRASWPDRLRAGRDAIIPLLSPVIIFGGILSGAVTVTEAAVLAVVYALFVGIFIYRELTLAKVYELFVSSSSMTSMAFWLIGTASVFAWILTIEQAPALLGVLVVGAPGGSATFLLLSIVIFTVLGGILDGMPALLILGPVFFPIATSLGIDLVHYGIVIIAAMGIGLFLPVVGVGMFIALSIARVDMGPAAVRFLPYLIMLVLMLIVVAFVPALTLVLPNLLPH